MHRKESLRIYVAGLILGVAVLIALGAFWHDKRHRVEAAARERRRQVQAGPFVEVAPVTPGKPVTTLQLTGECHPYAEVTLNARVNGYLTAIGIDKGDPVVENQLLAVVQAPETTEQYRGALADAQYKAELARRAHILRQRNLIAVQDDQQAASDAQVAAARVGELAVTRGYQVLKAPFTGTVTARYVDPGTLVQSSATPLFTISQLDRLRVYAFVDQKYAFYVKPGVEAELELPDRPGVRFKAKIARISGKLDPSTRMMLVEADYDNRRGDIVAGSYVRMQLRVPTPAYPQVPLDAVTQQGSKLIVPVVTDGGIVHYRDVEVGENDGREVQVLAGLRIGETVARHLGAGVVDGAHVQVLQASRGPGETGHEEGPPATTKGEPRTTGGGQPEGRVGH